MSWILGMPNLGHTMEEGKVQAWLKRVGDPVRAGEVVAIVESDKASFDVESPADGVLLAIHVEADTTVAVGAAIGLVGRPGEATTAESPAAAPRPGRKKVAPAARALAEELGIDPATLEGSGEDGLVTRDDVRAFAAGRSSGPKPLSPMRRAIADATQRAWQAVPHVALQSHADIDALLALGLPLTAAIGRACALALCEHGAFNGWLLDTGFQAAPHVALAFAVSAPGGLLTAVVPQAEDKSVDGLQAALSSLAAEARVGTLDGARTLGGTFTVSTLGRHGVDAFAPLIAAPQVAILGVGRLRRAAREGADGAPRFVSELTLTLAFDHRANDGVEAAQLLAAIVDRLERPQSLEVPA